MRRGELNTLTTSPFQEHHQSVGNQRDVPKVTYCQSHHFPRSQEPLSRTEHTQGCDHSARGAPEPVCAGGEPGQEWKPPSHLT